MSEWLEKTGDIEKKVLEIVGLQTKKVVDDLLPQIRLAALENEGAAIVDIRVGFDFGEKAEEVIIATEGLVQFPAKRAYAESTVESK